MTTDPDRTDLRRRVLAIAESYGPTRAAKMFEVHEVTLLRFLVPVGSSRATAALMAEKIDAVEKAQ